jgi:hypothetical protein
MSKNTYVVDQVDDDLWIICKRPQLDEQSLENCKEIATQQITQRIAEHQDMIAHLRTQLEEINSLTEKDIE